MDSHVRSERGISDRVSRRRVGRWAALTAVALVAVLALVSITAQPIASSSVTLTVVGDEEAEPIHLSALSYDDAGAAIHATTFEDGDATLAVQMPGLAAELSADSMIPNLTAKSLALTGTSAGGPVTLLAVWGEAETPEIVFVVYAGTKGFQDWGFDGVHGNYLFPRVMVFLAADSGAKSIPVASIPGATLTSFDGLYPGAGTGSLTLTAGLNVAANVDANDLPDDLKSILSSSDSEELLEGSLGNNDFSFLAGGAFSLPTIQLSATLPAFWEGAFPEWLSVGAPTIVVEIPLGGEGLVAATSIVFPMTVDVGGSLLVFDVNAELDMADDSFGFGATLSSPWVAPFGLDWLTLEATTISVAVPGSGAASGGGTDQVCQIWVPFYQDGKCWTIPPMDAITLIDIPGLCHALYIPCTTAGVIEEVIITPVITELRNLLEPFVHEGANLPPVVLVGGPYVVPEGGSTSLSVAGSYDPEGEARASAISSRSRGRIDGGKA